MWGAFVFILACEYSVIFDFNFTSQSERKKINNSRNLTKNGIKFLFSMAFYLLIQIKLMVVYQFFCSGSESSVPFFSKENVMRLNNLQSTDHPFGSHFQVVYTYLFFVRHLEIFNPKICVCAGAVWCGPYCANMYVIMYVLLHFSKINVYRCVCVCVLMSDHE